MGQVIVTTVLNTREVMLPAVFTSDSLNHVQIQNTIQKKQNSLMQNILVYVYINMPRRRLKKSRVKVNPILAFSASKASMLPYLSTEYKKAVSEVSKMAKAFVSDNTKFRLDNLKVSDAGKTGVVGIRNDFVVKKASREGQSARLEFYNMLVLSDLNLPHFPRPFMYLSCLSEEDPKGELVFCETKEVPAEIDESLLYDFILMENAGSDVWETYAFANDFEWLTLYMQVVCSLAMAQESCEFTHYDLHMQNVLIKPLNRPASDRIMWYQYETKDGTYELPLLTHKQVSLIDFGYSHCQGKPAHLKRMGWTESRLPVIQFQSSYQKYALYTETFSPYADHVRFTMSSSVPASMQSLERDVTLDYATNKYYMPTGPGREHPKFPTVHALIAHIVTLPIFKAMTDHAKTLGQRDVTLFKKTSI